MKTISKIFVIVLALVTSVGALAASDQKIDSEVMRKALQDSRICRAGYALLDGTDLGKLYLLSIEYLETRRPILLEDEHIARESNGKSTLVTSSTDEFIMRRLSNWSVQPRILIWDARPLITNSGLEARLNQYANWGIDWDRFFVDFVEEYKTKIGQPDIVCFSYANQRVEGP